MCLISFSAISLVEIVLVFVRQFALPLFIPAAAVVVTRIVAVGATAAVVAMAAVVATGTLILAMDAMVVVVAALALLRLKFLRT